VRNLMRGVPGLRELQAFALPRLGVLLGRKGEGEHEAQKEKEKGKEEKGKERDMEKSGSHRWYS